jgi:hypothetical protein
MEIDDSDFKTKITQLVEKVGQNVKKGTLDIAKEVLRLSQREVPHDTGELQNSGHLDPDAPADDIIVGYNKVYAAFQHEGGDGKRVITHWQKGRKGKYLEDPIKNNLSTFKDFFANILK